MEAAFDELKRIDSKSSLNPCVVIGLLSDPSPLQTRYSYYNYIVFDQDDIIKKSLKYVPTPIFIVYDGNSKVVKCHIPTKQDNRENISNLLLNTLLNQNLL